MEALAVRGDYRPFALLLGVFSDNAIAEMFSERAVIESWLSVERELAAAQADAGAIPLDAADEIAREVRWERIDPAMLWEATAEVGYPIVPLLAQLASACPQPVSRYLHWGATTQDIMDCALAMQLDRAVTRISRLVVEIGDELATLADTHRGTVMLGRTHSQPAVPITFGGKVAVWLAEMTRHVDRLAAARARAAVVQLFGAAGTGAALGPTGREVRERLAQRLGLGITHVPWHAARDNVAEVSFAVAAVAVTCGKIAREVIELSRREIGELREPDGHSRGASSTMPQKRNPIASEAVVALSAGAAQQLGLVMRAMEGTHERSTGEWQMEWDAIPTLMCLAGGALNGVRKVFAGLEVVPDRMLENLQIDGGLAMSEAVMMALAPVLGRHQAHELLYEVSREARSQGIGLREAMEVPGRWPQVDGLEPLSKVLNPSLYLGQTAEIVSEAIADWSSTRTLVIREDRDADGE